MTGHLQVYACLCTDSASSDTAALPAACPCHGSPITGVHRNTRPGGLPDEHHCYASLPAGSDETPPQARLAENASAERQRERARLVAYWRQRAEAFEWARPKPGDYVGTAGQERLDQLDAELVDARDEALARANDTATTKSPNIY